MKARRRSAAALLLLAVLVPACALQPERSVLDRFFGASRLRDRTVLASVATVIFEPLQDGIVTRFDIVRVIPENEASKQVIVEAPVKLPDGRIVSKTVTITMTRRERRWLVTAFR